MPAEAAASVRPRGARDQLFGIDRIGRIDGEAVASMTIGPWCIGPDGRPSYGSLGVLIDNLIGLIISPSAPAGHWPSTTELSASFAAPLPADGTVLKGDARVVESGAADVLAEAAIRAPDGAVIALITGRILFTPLGEIRVAAREPVGEPPPVGPALLDLLNVTITADSGGPVLELPGTSVVANPTGNVHGGISLSLAIVAALNAVQSDVDPLEVSGVHIAFLRPCPSSGIVRFVPTVVHRGRSVALVHVQCLRADGRVATAATVSCARRS